MTTFISDEQSPAPKRVLITGDRNWTDQQAINTFIDSLGSDTIIIHGVCPTGADKMANDYAASKGMIIDAYPADWKRYRRGAGPVRNQQMLDEGKPDLVVFFHNDLGQSKGTADMVRRAVKAHIKILEGVSQTVRFAQP